MEEKGQQAKDRVSPASIPDLPLHAAGGVLVPADKPVSPKNERIASPNPPPDAAITGPVRNVSNQSEALNTNEAWNSVNQPNAFTPQEQTYFYGASGYDDGSATWGDYSNYLHANNLQIVPPAMHNDNASLLFHPAYAYDAQMAYSQFSPVTSPLSPLMIDGQLFSPHQVPMSPNYYSHPISPQVTSALPTNSGQEAFSENVFLGPGSGYYLQYAGNNNVGYYRYPGDIGSGDSAPNRSMSSDTSSYSAPLTSAALYPSPAGIYGSYEHIFSQIPQQQTTYGHRSVSGSSTRGYPQSGSFRGYNGNSVFHGEASHLNRFVSEKVGKNKERDAVNMITESHDTTTSSRGPRASKQKGNDNINNTGDSKNDVSSRLDLELYNRPDFVTIYDSAKFFVIKSFSEENVHKSIKYSVWASTPLGNRKLDAAYQESKESDATCPVFLFFSVNASGQFCGVAEMVGPVDFVNDAEYWHQDRWSGQFRVKWHIIKDVPNSRFRHIILDNNDNKPVTHSRDSQEVKLEAGNAMLKTFKDHESSTSLLDDFSYYDEKEKDVQEKRSKEREFTKNVPVVNDTLVTQLADKVAESLHVEEHKEVQ
ncbi:YTH domain-containing protein ECT4-like [Bidens hawaiensis]|uniref:YTH domain-containing protein ECT4-like n=1 Tax=Bidens hawaiensis TaxID=980011 RepID=UPI004049C078